MEPRDQQVADLIARCALKDQSALEMLLQQHGAFLNGIAFRIVKSEDLSNDVLQEAFIQIWNNAAKYRPHLGKPLTWMASIVRYRAIDRINQEQRYQNTTTTETEDGTDIYDELASDSTPLGDAVHDEKTALIKLCLQQLTEKARQCVVLAYLEGYSREEIATRMDAKINTVKSWLSRGADKLKQCLETKLTTER